MEIEILKEEKTIIDEEFFTEEAIQDRAGRLAKEIGDEELEEIGMDRDYFRDVLISFAQSYGKPCKKLNMDEVEKLYLDLTKGLAEDE